MVKIPVVNALLPGMSLSCDADDGCLTTDDLVVCDALLEERYANTMSTK